MNLLLEVFELRFEYPACLHMYVLYLSLVLAGLSLVARLCSQVMQMMQYIYVVQ